GLPGFPRLDRQLADVASAAVALEYAVTDAGRNLGVVVLADPFGNGAGHLCSLPQFAAPVRGIGHPIDSAPLRVAAMAGEGDVVVMVPATEFPQVQMLDCLGGRKRLTLPRHRNGRRHLD